MEQKEAKTKNGTTSLIAILGIAAAFVLVVFLSNYVEARRLHLPDSYEDADLSLQGKRLKGWALGAEGMLADWYWMNSLQYVGTKILRGPEGGVNIDDLRPLNPRLLYPLLDNATDLDPHFIAVYSYGASVLPAIDPAQAIALTEKGIANNPEEWKLYQYLGYIHWRLKDYEKAAEAYEQGSARPGATAIMRQMAAVMRTRGGSRDTARQMYQQMLAEAEDQQSRSLAELRLMELDSLDERDVMDEQLKNIVDATGKCPQQLKEIVPLLAKVKLPDNKDLQINSAGDLVDPAGEPYQLDREKCVVTLGPSSKIPTPLVQ